MSELNLFDISEQICYVQCGFCTTFLLVSVPCNSMKTVVRVRCGHCSAVFSLNMTKASFLPFHLFHQPQQELEEDLEEIEMPVVTEAVVDEIGPDVSLENEEENIYFMNNQFVNKPPEKRQRAPSAYNRFIREEIKRLKAENPDMAHKAAFSTASKNWAHFPPIDQQKEGDGSQREENVTWESNVNNKGNEDSKVFRERTFGREEDNLFLW